MNGRFRAKRILQLSEVGSCIGAHRHAATFEDGSHLFDELIRDPYFSREDCYLFFQCGHAWLLSHTFDIGKARACGGFLVVGHVGPQLGQIECGESQFATGGVAI